MSAFRVAALVALGALVVVAPVLGAAAPAQAHNYLVSSTPAAGQTLTELPERFEVTTNGPLLTLGGSTGGFALQVKDAEGRFYGDGCVTVEGPTMSTAAALGAAGTYTVIWQVVSSDGHTVSDEFTFDWAPAAGQTASTGSATVPDCNGTAGGQAAGSRFKLEPDGETAHRTPVRLGRSSVKSIEVLDGVHEGDRVILSDMSQWNSADSVRLR
jgi:methionine-rich copper-binding protein CopC